MDKALRSETFLLDHEVVRRIAIPKDNEDEQIAEREDYLMPEAITSLSPELELAESAAMHHVREAFAKVEATCPGAHADRRTRLSYSKPHCSMTEVGHCFRGVTCSLRRSAVL
jgi:hypothetical protein